MKNVRKLEEGKFMDRFMLTEYMQNYTKYQSSIILEWFCQGICDVYCNMINMNDDADRDRYQMLLMRHSFDGSTDQVGEVLRGILKVKEWW